MTTKFTITFKEDITSQEILDFLASPLISSVTMDVEDSSDMLQTSEGLNGISHSLGKPFMMSVVRSDNEPKEFNGFRFEGSNEQINPELDYLIRDEHMTNMKDGFEKYIQYMKRQESLIYPTTK